MLSIFWWARIQHVWFDVLNTSQSEVRKLYIYIYIYIYTMDRYGYVWNGHIMFIKIEHRNLETRKTRNDFFVQVRKFLLPLSLKVLRHKEGEAQSFYSGFFISTPRQHVWSPPQGVSASKRKPTVFPRGRSHLYSAGI